MQIILINVYIIALLWAISNYHKIQQALQWWSSRQTMKLFLEAEEIRDTLLQESFVIRRNLDMLLAEDKKLANVLNQTWLHKIDSLHQSLAKLSDRLFPSYIDYNLPLAIDYLLQPWLTSNSHFYFHIDLPVDWRHEPAERSLIVLMALEEFLQISLQKNLYPTTIYITLKLCDNLGQLIVEIIYYDVSTLLLHSSLPELNYLCQSFQLLTSGKCFYRIKNLSLVWQLEWKV